MVGITKEEAEKELNELLQQSKPKKEEGKKEDTKPLTEPISEKSEKDDKGNDKVTKKVDDLENQAKQDEDILSKDEKDLSEEELTRKNDILAKTNKVDKRKAEIQNDIDSLIAKKKALEEEVNQTAQIKSEMKVLRDEIDSLKQEKAKIDAEKKIPEEQKILIDIERTRINKYLEEDANKPREQRREISKEELNDWYLEDPIGVQEWMSERSLRRARERAEDVSKVRNERVNEDLSRQMAESNARVLLKHPELDTSQRLAELRKQGKTDKEASDILCAENEKHRIALEIISSNPEKYVNHPNGPELVMAEMEKRLAGIKVSSESQAKIDALTVQVEELSAELAKLKGEDIGINSTVKPKSSAVSYSDEEKRIISTMEELGASKDRINSAVENYRKRKAVKA